jgi:hypothetical protein
VDSPVTSEAGSAGHVRGATQLTPTAINPGASAATANASTGSPAVVVASRH